MKIMKFSDFINENNDHILEIIKKSCTEANKDYEKTWDSFCEPWSVKRTSNNTYEVNCSIDTDVSTSNSTFFGYDRIDFSKLYKFNNKTFTVEEELHLDYPPYPMIEGYPLDKKTITKCVVDAMTEIDNIGFKKINDDLIENGFSTISKLVDWKKVVKTNINQDWQEYYDEMKSEMDDEDEE